MDCSNHENVYDCNVEKHELLDHNVDFHTNNNNDNNLRNNNVHDENSNNNKDHLKTNNEIERPLSIQHKPRSAFPLSRIARIVKLGIGTTRTVSKDALQLISNAAAEFVQLLTRMTVDVQMEHNQGKPGLVKPEHLIGAIRNGGIHFSFLTSPEVIDTFLFPKSMIQTNRALSSSASIPIQYDSVDVPNELLSVIDAPVANDDLFGTESDHENNSEGQDNESLENSLFKETQKRKVPTLKGTSKKSKHNKISYTNTLNSYFNANS